jgi:hypothetical protein
MMAAAMKDIDRDDIVFFCSGVSNSSEINEAAFKREYDLLQEQVHLKKKLVYFSSYFVNFDEYQQKKYYQHKSQIEKFIQDTFDAYTIYRLPQVVGFSYNPHTLTNFIYNSIAESKAIPVFKNSKRNVIDIRCIKRVVKYANNENLFHNRVTNLIATINFDIENIIQVFETVMDKKVDKYFVETQEHEFPILLEEPMKEIYERLGIVFNGDYLETLIKNYYERKYVV